MTMSEKIKNNELISKRISKLLESKEFELSEEFLIYLHNYLFQEIEEFPYPDKFRKYNITKSEIILNGDSVIYPDYHNIRTYLKYDIDEEKYRKKQDEKSNIESIIKFNSKIWGTHPFGDGNTRTTSLFIEKYLISLGYDINNDIFKDNNRYYRSSLVRSNYYNYDLGIRPNFTYLQLFYKKLLIDNLIVLDLSELIIPELFDEKNKHKKILKR